MFPCRHAYAFATLIDLYDPANPDDFYEKYFPPYMLVKYVDQVVRDVRIIVPARESLDVGSQREIELPPLRRMLKRPVKVKEKPGPKPKSRPGVEPRIPSRGEIPKGKKNMNKRANESSNSNVGKKLKEQSDGA